MPSDKTNIIFDSLADQQKNKTDVVSKKEEPLNKMPTLDDLKEIWEELNTQLKDPKRLTESDFVIKKFNELYYAGAYLRAAIHQGTDRRDSYLSSLTQSNSLGSNNSFIRKECKELKKRLAS